MKNICCISGDGLVEGKHKMGNLRVGACLQNFHGLEIMSLSVFCLCCSSSSKPLLLNNNPLLLVFDVWQHMILKAPFCKMSMIWVFGSGVSQ